MISDESPVERYKIGGTLTFQPTENGALVNMVHVSTEGQRWQSGLWFAKTGFDESDILDLVNAVYTCYNSYLKGMLSSSNYFGPFEGIDMRTQGNPIVYGDDGPTAGTSGGERVPRNAAAVLTLRTNKRGRSFRGRMYYGGFTESEIDGGPISDDMKVALLNFAGCVLIESGAIGWIFSVRSGVQNKQKLGTAVLTPITLAEVRSNIVGTQRRRLRRP